MPDLQPKIMVVDDDPGMRLTLEGVLEDEGFDVVSAEDGYRAIELAKQSHFDLIFMDIKMPGINGGRCLQGSKEGQPELNSHHDNGLRCRRTHQGSLGRGCLRCNLQAFRDGPDH